MIFILHGDNFPRSRSVILKLQEKYNTENKVEINILETSPQQFKEHVTSFSIFDEPPFIVIDVSAAGKLKQDPYLEILQNISEEATVIIVSSKQLTKSNIWIKNATKLKAKVFESSVAEESNIFRFVDKVFEGNRVESYKELRNLFLSGQDQFYIFSMLLYGLRNLLAVKFESPHLVSTSPYVISKTTKQASRFNDAQILNLVGYFYDLDKQVKIGEIPSDVLVPLAVERVLSF